MDALLVNTLYSFILITIRFSSLFLTTPLFSSAVIPLKIKAGLSLLISLLIYPTIFTPGREIAFPASLIEVGFQVGNELLVGVVLGFVTYLTFSTVHLAGQFMDLRMGFAMVNVIDPFTSSDAPLMGQFKNILALLIFLVCNGHHQIIAALIKSFQILPVTKPMFTPSLMEFVLRVGGDIFLLGFRLALPIIAVLFIVDVLFGFIARTVPQMNVFIMGFPVKIILGILVLFLAMPVLVKFLVGIIDLIQQQAFQVLKLMQ